MKERLIIFLVGILFSGGVLAQSDITGTVVSQEDGQPIIGASVVVAGSKVGTVTDTNGRFTVSVPEGKKLVVSYIGMQSKTVVPKQDIRVVLEPNATIQEVVVTGMQNMDKRLFTGSTTFIDAEDAETVELKVDSDQVKYLETLPLHDSQEKVEQIDEYAIFRYHLVPTYDFMQEILSMGAGVEVTKPEWFREKIREEIERMVKKYSDNERK